MNRGTTIQFDKFYSTYMSLAGTRAGYTRIGRIIGIDPQTVKKIDTQFRIRTRKFLKQIEGEEKARGKILEAVLPAGYMEEAVALLEKTGKTAKTYTQIAERLRKKYGVGERHTIAEINRRRSVRSEQANKTIRRRATIKGTKIVSDSRFEQLISEKEQVIDENTGKVVVDEKTGKPLERFKYSIPEIAAKTRLSEPGTSARWRRNFQHKRSLTENREVANRKKAENLRIVKRSPTQTVAARMLEGGVRDDEAIMRAMIQHDIEHGIRKKMGAARGTPIDRVGYLRLLSLAKKEVGQARKKQPVASKKQVDFSREKHKIEVARQPAYKPVEADAIYDSGIAKAHRQKPQLFSRELYPAESPERILEGEIRKGRDLSQLRPLGNALIKRGQGNESRIGNAVARLTRYYAEENLQMGFVRQIVTRVDYFIMRGFNDGAVLDRILVSKDGKTRAEMELLIRQRRGILGEQKKLAKF